MWRGLRGFIRVSTAFYTRVWVINAYIGCVYAGVDKLIQGCIRVRNIVTCRIRSSTYHVLLAHLRQNTWCCNAHLRLLKEKPDHFRGGLKLLNHRWWYNSLLFQSFAETWMTIVWSVAEVHVWCCRLPYHSMQRCGLTMIPKLYDSRVWMFKHVLPICVYCWGGLVRA